MAKPFFPTDWKKSVSFPQFLLSFLFPACLQAGVGDVTEIHVQEDVLTLQAGAATVVFHVCRPNILRISFRPPGAGEPDTLIAPRRDWPAVRAQIDTSGDALVITTAALRLTITRRPMRFTLYDASGRQLLQEMPAVGLHDNGIRLRVSGGNFYGIYNNFTGSLSKNQGGTISAGMQGHAGAPFVWTTAGYGLLMNSDSGEIKIADGQLDFTVARARQFHRLGAKDGTKTPARTGVELYLLVGNPREIFAAMTAVSGAAPLFPRFAHGFLNTEWGMDQAELLGDIKTYRAKGIPLDAYILDFDWMAYGEDNYGEFRWGPKFPDGPSGRLKQVTDSLGVKLFGIRKPRVHLDTEQGRFAKSRGFFLDSEKDYFSKQQVGRLNFHMPEVRQWYFDSFWDRHHSFATGIIGYWNDEADSYGGNLMFLQMQRANYEGQRRRNNLRVWSINRNFFLGAQRYAYGHWSGDIPTGFESMAQQRLFMLSSVMLGSAWWGMDIGGFKDRPAPENYIRWMQFGAFVPIFRVHGTLNQEREPWQFGPEAEAIVTKYIRLRYALLPYIYSHAWENHLTGLSLVRPLVWDYPDDPRVAELYSQWLFGESLLVTPVVQPHADTVSVYLPAGTWFDFWTEQRHTGGRWVNVPVTLRDLPIFVKAGAIVPMAPVGRFVDDPQTPPNPLTLHCYPDGAGSFTLYDDDGMTYEYEQGRYAVTAMTFADHGDHLLLRLAARQGGYQPPVRDFLVAIHALPATPAAVVHDGRRVQQEKLDRVRAGTTTGWAYDGHKQLLYVRLSDNGELQSLRVVR
ncbi:MAG: DUF5110 domain-containing protein [candidate division KSB1 bacterium]|nr:DUF5110 domain-containing protein [candidate division KSB1 bacterium]MDZ7274050.1 DUF5110 domain-containing protein [candidate division KSB1 bacterium]MDZ7286422.1 DUF5110 domain-containing protein [candidate division KSB1 bacterium]MDZ7296650.1 DUF5110 domain-containing protein [candidate division KSB1 bacterium]MDZ7307267.1 DUF5110 domain-containing protein [candidate division KSB1 bacterium]